jgi:electron transfer flavoprotein alpha subunit
MNQDIYVVIEHLRGQVADISYVMLAAARDLASVTGGSVVGVLLGHNSQDLANALAADRVLYGDDPALAEFSSDAYQQVLAKLLSEEEPRGVLFGSTTIGTDVAGVLSARLGLPIVSSCLTIADGKIASKICGGKIMTESDLADTTTLITMIPGGYKPEQGQSDSPPEIKHIAVSLGDLKVILKSYIEPEITDVDITKENILIAVGRGIQNEDNIELAEELANLLGGAVCASRPIVDQGWLPTARLVGKSGHSVKPKLYLALGISGAPEHVEGMADAEMVVAINIDPGAPIFDIAKYGVEIDLFDLIDVLIEKIEEETG